MWSAGAPFCTGTPLLYPEALGLPVWFVGAATHCFQLSDSSGIVPDPGKSLGVKMLSLASKRQASSLDFYQQVNDWDLADFACIFKITSLSAEILWRAGVTGEGSQP